MMPMFLLWLIINCSCIQSIVYMCNSTASCGCSKDSTIINRIVNGETAEIDAWNWAVSLKVGKYLCGGAILSSTWIITAAHCLAEILASDIIVYAGSNYRWMGNQIKSASYFVVHPEYNSNTLTNDIGLIKLVSPLDMTNSHVRSICLPSVDNMTLARGEWPEANTTVVAVGWGVLKENGSIPNTLQQVSLKTIEYQALACLPSIQDHRVQLCATVPDGSKDTCQGDSGGPLMMFSSDHRWILVGLTSYGEGCARANFSGVYTRVAAFQDWINSTMNVACIQTCRMYFLSFILLAQLLQKVSSFEQIHI